jgi:hypothetical protein
VCVQPVLGLPASTVHGSPSSHDPPPVDTHCPFTHASDVAGLLSEHVFPSSGTYTQPDAGLQLSSVHGLLSLHVNGMFRQPVASHVSAVQAFPSSQLRGVHTHAPVAGSQESVVHGLPSVQSTGS